MLWDACRRMRVAVGCDEDACGMLAGVWQVAVGCDEVRALRGLWTLRSSLKGIEDTVVIHADQVPCWLIRCLVAEVSSTTLRCCISPLHSVVGSLR